MDALNEYVKQGLKYAGIEVNVEDFDEITKIMEGLQIYKNEFEKTNVDEVVPYLVTNIGGRKSE